MKKPKKHSLVWSFGGGVQSVAIGVLVKEGVLPKPDLVGIADTGREKRTTWEYLEKYMQPYLDQVGVKIEVIPHSLSTRDLYDPATGKTYMPVYDEAEGRMGTYCSGHWKRDTFERWLRLQGIEECTCWIGYSMDELWRVKNDHRPWCKLEFPLIDRMINRVMCKRLIEQAGLPVPLKSRCWCCPHMNDAEWAEVASDPVDWEKAVALDEEIRESDPEGTGLYLYSGRVPLKMATFAADPAAPPRPCETGFCWT